MQRRRITPRDIEILNAVDRCPLTAGQLLKLSTIFLETFPSLRTAQIRLQKLREFGLLKSWPYATTQSGGVPDYFKLSQEGFRVLHNHDTPYPSKRYFSPVAIGQQHHQHSLADFVVHTLVAADSFGCEVQNFYPENLLRIPIGEETLLPDAAFELVPPYESEQLNYVVEIDNSTETVRSVKDVDTWERKVRLYNKLADQMAPHRFRVLVVTTRSSTRFKNILAAAHAFSTNRRRSLFYAIDLASYLAENDPMTLPCFLDEKLRHVALIPEPKYRGVERQGQQFHWNQQIRDKASPQEAMMI